METPWSFSHLSTFEHCARQYEWKYVLKMKEKEVSENIQWGNKVDTALAERAKGYPLPPAFQPYEYIGTWLDRVRETGAEILPKHKFGIGRDLQPRTFFAKDVWFRGEFDLAIKGDKRVHLDDYKTGKKRDDQSQLKLYAGAAFALWPEVDTVSTRFVWLASKQTTPMIFRRSIQAVIWQEMMPRIRRMELAREKEQFPPTPSGLCAWCPHATCEFRKERP
jgi:hypothetical protein